LTLDVFLESSDAFDREATEEALARNGLASDSMLATGDGGEASVSVDDDGCVFVIRSLTLEVAEIVFDVAQSAHLAILPADGTPNALVVGDAGAPEELEVVDIPGAEALFSALRLSEELRGARST
jgi:hypothetical protein